MGDGLVDVATRTALVGRRDELAELRQGFDDARAGRGRLFLIAGEAGIGKTRLVEAVAEEAELTEAAVAWGRCREEGGAPPLWPWVQVLRSCTADAPDDALSRRLGQGAPDVAQLVPELARRIPRLEPAPPSASSGARARLFDSVLRFLANVAAEGGLVVALDDLHAADEASLRLLHHVAGQLETANLMLVGTYRDAEARSSRHLHRLLAAIARHGRRLVLAGLSEHEVAVLVERASGDRPTAATVRSIHLATDGNPFIVQEAVRLLGSEPGAEAVVLPEDVHALVRRRLEPVGAPVRHVLGAAAVLGREFDLPALERLSGVRPEELFDVVDHGRRLGMVEEGGPGRWRFAHALVREALYDALRPSERVVLHRRAAEVLEGLAASGDHGRITELASHFFEAARGGDGANAAHYCALAGHQAMGVLAFEEAALQFSRALEALALDAPVDERRRCQLLLAMAAALLPARDFPRAQETYRRALKAARAAGSAELLAEAAVGLAGQSPAPTDQTQRSVLEEARAALPAEDTPLCARVLVALAGATATYATRRTLSDEAVAVARRAGDPVTLRDVLWTWQLINTEPGQLERRLADADEVLRLAQEAGDGEGVPPARRLRAAWLFEAGDVAAARAELEEAARDAHRLRLPFVLGASTFSLGALALLEGRLVEAERLATDAVAAGEHLEVEHVFPQQLWALRREQGRFDEMADAAGRLLEMSPDTLAAFHRAMLALALAEQGAADEARRHLEAVARDLLAQVHWIELAGPALVAEVSWLLGDATWADATYSALARWPGRHVVVGITNFSLGSSDRHLGQQATLLGRHHDAQRHFSDAHRLHERLGAPGWLAHGRLDHARMLVQPGGPEDQRRAAELAGQAGEAYRALGMTVHAERAVALLGGTTATAGARPERGTFRLEGEYWALEYGGTQARLRDSKGLRYLARLLQRPGLEHHALDLVVGEGSDGRRPSAAATRDAGLAPAGPGDAGAVLDARAKAAYKRRVVDLREEIDEATANGDAGRLAWAQDEMDFLLAELSAAVGLGGRDRKAASDAEKARQSVTRAIRGAIDRVAEAHPQLGGHLRATVRTGIYTSYSPDPRVPIEWSVSTR